MDNVYPEVLKMRRILMAVFLTGLLSAFAASQGEQVTICHVPPGNPDAASTITVGAKAAAAHMANHPWDHSGPCEAGPSNLSIIVLAALLLSWAAILLYRRSKSYQP